jgi:hypothetical protein
MPVSRYAFLFPLFLVPSLAAAQDRGFALNLGRGLDSGMSVGWTFKENWTLRPILGATYSQQTGFRPSVGSTVLRSFGSDHRVYGYVGAGIYYGSANNGAYSTFAGGAQTPGTINGNALNNSFYSTSNIAYLTAPAGLRARIYNNFEAFAEAAYQRTLSGQFGINQVGQFSGNGRERFGATFGVSMRLQ